MKIERKFKDIGHLTYIILIDSSILNLKIKYFLNLNYFIYFLWKSTQIKIKLLLENTFPFWNIDLSNNKFFIHWMQNFQFNNYNIKLHYHLFTLQLFLLKIYA